MLGRREVNQAKTWRTACLWQSICTLDLHKTSYSVHLVTVSNRIASPRPAPSTGTSCENRHALKGKVTYFYLFGVKYGYKHYLPFTANHLLANSKQENKEYWQVAFNFWLLLSYRPNCWQLYRSSAKTVGAESSFSALLIPLNGN